MYTSITWLNLNKILGKQNVIQTYEHSDVNFKFVFYGGMELASVLV